MLPITYIVVPVLCVSEWVFKAILNYILVLDNKELKSKGLSC